jgi:5-methylcytosine-specific restriction protein B
MNTADRSIALVDHALRRRFSFIGLYPMYTVLEKYQTANGFDAGPLVETLRRVNKAIADPHYEVGISFFMKPGLATNLEDVWTLEIEPYLEEYFFDQPAKVGEFRWEKVGKQILP